LPGRGKHFGEGRVNSLAAAGATPRPAIAWAADKLEGFLRR
jgi:hypothetical protein